MHIYLNTVIWETSYWVRLTQDELVGGVNSKGLLYKFRIYRIGNDLSIIA